jgi:hypothetical protein
MVQPVDNNALPTQDDAALESDVRLFLQQQKQSNVDKFSANIRDRIEFRLLGYSNAGKVINWREDVANVTRLEKTLVVDPLRLKQEFEMIRRKREEGMTDEELEQFIRANSKFSMVGGHIFPNARDTLMRVRREGWIIMAGFTHQGERRQQFTPVGYNYGLQNMPEDDEEFRLLTKDTLMVNDSMKREMNAKKIAINWRTGITEKIDANVLHRSGIDVSSPEGQIDVRRMGIASALKYVMTRLAQMHESDEIYFNIGTIRDPKSKERQRNYPSFEHNKHYFGAEHGFRSSDSEITIKGLLGERDKVGKVRWYTRGDKVEQAMRRLTAEDNVLVSRGWNIARLEQITERIFEQIKAERGEGKHL